MRKNELTLGPLSPSVSPTDSILAGWNVTENKRPLGHLKSEPDLERLQGALGCKKGNKGRFGSDMNFADADNRLSRSTPLDGRRGNG